MTTRGTRLETSGWTPCEVARSFAIEKGLDPDAIWEHFRDYWTAKSGANASKLDWLATWRNWCRRAAEDKGRVRGISSRFERRDDNCMPSRPAMIWVGGLGYNFGNILALRHKRASGATLEPHEQQALEQWDG